MGYLLPSVCLVAGDNGGTSMSTAIFIGALIIGSAINPEYVGSLGEEAKNYYGWMFFAFVCYDLLNMRKQ